MYRAGIIRRSCKLGFRAASSSQHSGRRPRDAGKTIKDKLDNNKMPHLKHEIPGSRPQGITSDEASKSLTTFPMELKTALRVSCSSSVIVSDSDGELELLELDQTIQMIGEHELKTSPLVTRDAIVLPEQFAQRGLLGSVLSVHATGLPQRTRDRRIYLNLDAPSSGLVCGVQTRPRLTTDGGASLLATEARFETRLECQTGLPSPESSEHILVPVFPSGSHYLPPTIQLNTPIIDLVASSSANYSLRDRPALGAVYNSPEAFSQANPSPAYPTPNTTPQKAPQQPVANPVFSPLVPGTSEGVATRTSAGSSYAILIQVLCSFHQAGVSHPEKSKVCDELAKRKPPVYTGKLKKYLESAVAAGVITLAGKSSQQKVALVKAYMEPDTTPVPEPQASSAAPASRSSPNAVPPVITALLSVIVELSGNPKGCALMSALSGPLKQHQDGDFKKAGYPRLKQLVDAAVERGLVSLTQSGGSHLTQSGGSHLVCVL